MPGGLTGTEKGEGERVVGTVVTRRKVCWDLSRVKGGRTTERNPRPVWGPHDGLEGSEKSDPRETVTVRLTHEDGTGKSWRGSEIPTSGSRVIPRGDLGRSE